MKRVAYMDNYYKIKGKRMVDVCIALSVLLFFSPFLLLVMSSLYLITHENPLFIQERPGQHQRLFNLYKVRTMYAKPAPLLTKLCRFLRRYSLDELPQFVNVLLGDMSVVGPRPLLSEYLPLYSPSQLRRHEVRPGISGWAQINGRNAIPWQKRFALDIWYVDHLSFRLDVYIMLHTLRTFIHTADVREDGLAEHEKFRGNTICRSHMPEETLFKQA